MEVEVPSGENRQKTNSISVFELPVGLHISPINHFHWTNYYVLHTKWATLYSRIVFIRLNDTYINTS